jgi:hypothetical protein
MKTIVGSMLDEISSGIILQQVNAQGCMGSGFAKALFEKWPEVRARYYKTLGPAYTQDLNGQYFMGSHEIIQVEPEIYVVNIVSQRFFGRNGGRYTSYDALDDALKALAPFCEGKEIHHPALGAGLGGGRWPIIASIIEENLGTDTTLWLLPS